MHVAVNSHPLPVYKKNRIASCTFETTVVLFSHNKLITQIDSYDKYTSCCSCCCDWTSMLLSTVFSQSYHDGQLSLLYSITGSPVLCEHHVL